MATLRTVIIDTDSAYPGYDYTAFDTAEAGEQGDISATTGSDEYVVFECYATSGTADSRAQGGTILGWTTESGNYIEVTGLNDSAYGHKGVWDTGEYRLVATNAATRSENIEQAFTYFRGIQISCTDSGAYEVLRCRNANDIYVEKCIIRNETAGGGTVGLYIFGTAGSGSMYASNNIVYDVGNGAGEPGIYGGHAGTGKVYCYNNTVCNCYEGIRTSYGDTVAKNNIIKNCTDDYDGTFDVNSGYNVNDTTGAEGAWRTTHATGTATSYGANKLNDSGGGLSATQVGSFVKNTTDTTYSYVTAVDSDIQLTLNDDIFDDGNEGYEVYTNMYGSVIFDGSTYLLSSSDTVARDKGKDLSSDGNYPITDDILGTTRS